MENYSYKKQYPLVSCLCVTKNRIDQIARVIGCFQAQTYANKQLVIIYEDRDKHIHEFLRTIEDLSIKRYEICSEPKQNLGDLRNLSVQYADGEYVC